MPTFQGRLFLCRHAETLWNAERRVQGLHDIELSAKGLEQAQSLAERFDAFQLKDATMWTSPLQRAHKTALAVQARHNCELLVDERLTEIDTGMFTGMTMAELRVHPAWIAHLEAPYETGYGDKGESMQETMRRLDSLYASLQSLQGDVIWVTHAALVRLSLIKLLGIHADKMYEITASNARITLFEFHSRGMKFCYHNY